MNIEEPKAMREVRELRETVRRATENMTPEERREYFRDKTDRFEKRLGRKLPRRAPIKA